MRWSEDGRRIYGSREDQPQQLWDKRLTYYGHETQLPGVWAHKLSNPTLVVGPKTLTLTGNTFTNNTTIAARIGVNGDTTTPILSGNKATGNRYNGIEVSGIINTVTLPAGAGIHYVLRELQVGQGATLTIPAGVVVKLQGALAVYGTLKVQGTAASPVYFTSIKDDSVGGDTNGDGDATSPKPNDWGQISIENTGMANIDHAVLRYGGVFYCDFGCYSRGILDVIGGTLTLTNSAVAYSDGPGIRGTSGSSVAVSNSTISDNGYPGAEKHNGGQPGIQVTGQLSIANSTVKDNSGYGIYVESGNSKIYNNNIYSNWGGGVINGSGSSTVVNAENNYWGSVSGPAPFGTGNGINYTTRYDSSCQCSVIDKFLVDADPWLGKSTTYGADVS